MLRFRVKNEKGEEKWIERKIANYAIYKTSEKMERRYKVKMKLKWKDFEKEVLVNLNDRSHLEFPLLLGTELLERRLRCRCRHGRESAGLVLVHEPYTTSFL